VFLVAPAAGQEEAPAAEAEALISALIEEGVAPKTIARVVSRTTSLARNAIYAEVLARRKES